MTLRRATLVLALLLATLPTDARAQRAKKGEPTFADLRELLQLYRINHQRSASNEAVRTQLAKIKEVPGIRTHCRRLFKTNLVTDATMDELSDWLCLELDTTADKVDDLKLSAVLRYLDKNAPRKK
jgi:hypothetical protein